MSNNSKKTLIIGAGGVGRVAAHKCALNADVFGEITIASRRRGKCDEVAQEILKMHGVSVKTAQVDADHTEELIALIRSIGADIVMNIALPYQDLTIMDACAAAKTHYLDTANYEHPSEAHFEYKLQWERDKLFRDAGIMGLLGSGFDPGVTNVFCAYAQKHYFDEIHYLDILDCNAGDHGYAFATNFNPEINLREVSAEGRYWENDRWITTPPLDIKMVWDYPEVGGKDSYLLYHEELESLTKNLRGLKRARFFMTFGQSYLTHMRCLENVGMLGIDAVDYNGTKIVPIQFLAALLPDPATLGARTKGKTNIGCVFEGVKNGEKRKIYIYNVCDHEACYKEVASQAISYTTGVPAMIGAKLILEGKWLKNGVYNMEQLDPDPFMDELAKQGLPWQVIEMKPHETFEVK